MKKTTKKSNPELPNDGERMVPSLHKGKLMYAEHLSRYEAALEIVENKVVLDIASGSGYGTKLLSSRAKKVFGVDISKDAVDYANKYFSSKNVTYLVGDGEKIPIDDHSVDVVITFETIEHIKNYKNFLKEVTRILKKDGIVIVSTPNDLEFAEGNHFHLHEFQEKELLDLLKKDYKYIDKYYQATSKSVGIGDDSLFSKEGEVEGRLINLSHITSKQYLYFYFVCSNKKINTKIESKVYIGEHYSDRQMKEINDELIRLNGLLVRREKTIKSIEGELAGLTKQLHDVYHSTSWRVTKPLRKVNKIVKK